VTATPPVPAPFLFNARVIEWHDGDTGTFTVDRGCRDFSTWSVRVVGCNAIELDDPGGAEAQAALTRRLPPGTPVVLATVKPDRYGDRKDAAVFYVGPDGGVRNLADTLTAEHWAAAWSGAGTRAVPPWPRPERAPA
jgi:endonuclease YncB( thermonuclease family)